MIKLILHYNKFSSTLILDKQFEFKSQITIWWCYHGLSPAENHKKRCLIFKSNTVVNDKDNFKKVLLLKDSNENILKIDSVFADDQ